MRTLLSVTLAGLPPTVNHLYRTSARGARSKTRAGRAWQSQTAALLRAMRREREPYGGDVALHVLFVTADRRRWDIDNRVKALQDCLQMAGVIEDDRQIQRLVVERKHGRTTATEIALTELEGPEEAEGGGAE